MSITVEATYEDGKLTPAQPLPLTEREQVQITIARDAKPEQAASEAAEEIVRRSHGLMGWTGDSETLQRLALDPEFGPEES